MSPDTHFLGNLRDGAGIGPWELSTGWAWASLDDVTEPPTNIDPRKLGRVFTYIDLTAIEAGKIGRAQEVEAASAPSRARQLAKLGDTLFSGVRVYLKNIGLVDEVHDGAIASTAFCVLRPTAAIDPRYLNFFVNWQRFINSLLPLQRGNSPPAVLDSDVRAQPIPIAPLLEQRRIVARIDELFAEIDEGEGALERARQGLDTWRRALLKAAVTGELTRDWREANRPAEAGADAAIITRSDPPYNVGPYAIPSGWIWTTIGQAGEVCRGRQRAPQHHSGPHMRPYLRVANVLEDLIDTSDVKFMNFTPSEFERYQLRAGDILLNEGQSLDLIGRSAIYRAEIEGCCLQKTLLRFRASKAVVPEYAQIVFLHYLHSKRFRRAAPITTNMAHLTLERLLPIEFPSPPKAEQEVIVARYREMRDAIVDLDTAIEGRDRVALRQAILKAAFQGRLVPQDLTDEPACVLLARLRGNNQQRATRRRRARASAPFSHPSLPGLTQQSVDPRVKPAGDE